MKEVIEKLGYKVQSFQCTKTGKIKLVATKQGTVITAEARRTAKAYDKLYENIQALI